MLRHDQAAESLEELIQSARRTVPIAASFAEKSAFWSEPVAGGASGRGSVGGRARVAANHRFLGADHQAYTQRVRKAVERVRARYEPLDYRIEIEGGLVLVDEFLRGLAVTQWQSFSAAFEIVVLTLAFLVRRGGVALVVWAVVANVLPVLAVLGLMGWAGIGIDPANAMLAAILMVIVVDDSIHLTLRFQREREAGRTVAEAIENCFLRVGEALLTSSLRLSLGFGVMLFAEWGGLVFFGFLSALGVLLALVGDLVLLPAAMLVILNSYIHQEVTQCRPFPETKQSKY